MLLTEQGPQDSQSSCEKVKLFKKWQHFTMKKYPSKQQSVDVRAPCLMMIKLVLQPRPY